MPQRSRTSERITIEQREETKNLQKSDSVSYAPCLDLESRPKKRLKRDDCLPSRAPQRGRQTQGQQADMPPKIHTPIREDITASKIQRLSKSRPSNLKSMGRSIPNPSGAQEAAQLLRSRQDLPIWSKRPNIRQALRRGDCLLLVGETGSGKSTQVPQILCSEPWCKRQTVNVKVNGCMTREIEVGGMIAVTEPRRIATQTLSQRVDREMVLSSLNTRRVPARAGYSVRFASNMPPQTKIKFVTEGVLLQEMIKDTQLKQYSAIIVDEIHERSVDVDLIAGFLRRLLHGDKRGRGGIPLKIVFMSATLDLGGLEAFFSRPEARPNYQPGKNHDTVLASYLQPVQVKNAASDLYHTATERYADQKQTSGWLIGHSVPSTDSHKLEEQSRTSDVAQRRCGGADADCPSSRSGLACSDNVKSTTAHDSHFRESSATLALMTALSRQTDSQEDETKTGVLIEYVEGREHDVELFHEKQPQSDYLNAMLRKILHVHTSEPLPGDILAFLTGQDDIASLQVQLEQDLTQLATGLPRFKVMPLYGSLPAQVQQEAFEKVQEKNTRKIVLATNIAESSVTVMGVRYVIDSGKVKVKQYRSSLRMESLLVKSISRVSAIQRKGRAGREGPGKCWRLYTEDDYAKLEQKELPEILRTDVVEAILKMKARGVQDVFAFPLMDSPDASAMQRALLQLTLLGALDATGKLTDAGLRMSAYPLPAIYGKVLITAANYDAGILLDVIDVVACITAESEIFLQPRTENERDNFNEYRESLWRREGDILTYLTTIQRYVAETSDQKIWCRKRYISDTALNNALAIRGQLQRICLSQNLLTEAPTPGPRPFEPASPERAVLLTKVFLAAFATKTATLGPRGNYITTQGKHTITIHPSSVLYGKKTEAIMFLEHAYTTKSYAKMVSVVQADWITEVMFT